MFRNKLWKHLPQWRIFIKMIFELLQFSYKGIPATFGNADSEHNEEGIQTTLLYDHPMFS